MTRQCVQRKLACSVGGSPTRATVRSPVAWVLLAVAHTILQLIYEVLRIVHIRHAYPRRAFTSYLTLALPTTPLCAAVSVKRGRVECIEQRRPRATIGGSGTDKNSGKLRAPADTGVDGPSSGQLKAALPDDLGGFNSNDVLQQWQRPALHRTRMVEDNDGHKVESQLARREAVFFHISPRSLCILVEKGRAQQQAHADRVSADGPVQPVSGSQP